LLLSAVWESVLQQQIEAVINGGSERVRENYSLVALTLRLSFQFRLLPLANGLGGQSAEQIDAIKFDSVDSTK